MFEVTVTVEVEFEDSPTLTYTREVDLMDESITSEGQLDDFVADLLEAELEGADDHSFSYSKLSEGVDLGEAFEYVEFADENHWGSSSDTEAIIEAAIYLSISASQIEEAYYGEFSSKAEFAEHFFESCYESLPDWVVVDWEATYEASLRFDFVDHNGYFFRSI